MLKISHVWAIAKKELRSFFDHPVAYVLLLIFTGLSYYFFFKINTISREASMRAYFELLPWFFLFFIPALTMRSFSEEYRRGTIETLLTSPVTNLEVVIGKFLGNFLFSASPLVISIMLPLSMAKYGRFDYGVLLAQYIGAIFIAAALASLGLWMSAMTKNQIIALLSTVVSGFLLLMIQSDFITISLPHQIGEILRQLSVMSHASSISRGVIDFRDVVYFLGFLLVFLALTLTAVNRWLGYGRDLSVNYGIAILIIAAIVLNVLVMRLPWRLDLTRDHSYTLSNATIKIVKGIKTPVDITVFATDRLPPQVETTARDVWDILGDYERISNGKIRLKKADPSKDNAAAQKAQEMGIQQVQFNVMSQGELKLNQGYFGLSIAGKKDHQTIPFIEGINDFEYQISSALAKLSKSKLPTIGFLQGHGEGNVYSGYQALESELGKIANTDTLTMTATTNAIPKNYDLLLALAPTGKMNQHDTDVIDAYIQDGGSAIFLQDGVNVELQYLIAEKNTADFNGLYQKWGFKVNNDLVYDLQANAQVTTGSGFTRYIIPYPYWIRASADPKKALTKNIEESLMPWASSITIISNRNGKVLPVFETSDAAGLEKDNFDISPQMQKNFDKRNLKSHILAVSAQVGKGRVLVVADSDLVKDQFAQDSPQNVLLILNAVDIFTQAQGLSEIRSKGAIVSTLNIKSAGQFETLRYANIILGSIVILALGAFRLLQRSRRQALDYTSN